MLNIPVLFIYLFIYFYGGWGIQIQGLSHARKTFHHWGTPKALHLFLK